MNIEKVKEALEAAKEELPELSSAPKGKEPRAIKASRLVREALSALAELEKPESTCKWDLVGFTYWPKCRAENCTDKMSFGKNIAQLYTFCPFCGRKIEPRA